MKAKQESGLLPENQFQLVASVVEKETIRFTPAGIPILSVVLRHGSKQLEANVEREVEFEIPAIAIGNIVNQLESVQSDTLYSFTGFMAMRNRRSRTLLFHVTDFVSVTN